MSFTNCVSIASKEQASDTVEDADADDSVMDGAEG